jgi:hypothetical protein
MSERCLILIASILLLFSPCCSAAIDTEAKACSVLINVATKDHFVAEDAPLGDYRCEHFSEEDGFYVIGLHYRRSIPDARPQSTLVGWFAISKASGEIYHWDMANLVIGGVIRSRR